MPYILIPSERHDKKNIWLSPSLAVNLLANTLIMKRLFFFVCLLAISLIALSQEKYIKIDSLPGTPQEHYQFHKNLEDYLYLLEDSTGTLSFEEASSSEYEELFVPFTQIPQPFNQEYHYWVKFNLNPGQNQSDNIFVALWGSHYFNVFITGSDTVIQMKTGSHVPSSENDEIYTGSQLLLFQIDKDTFEASDLTPIYINFHNQNKTEPKFRLQLFSNDAGYYVITDKLIQRAKERFPAGAVQGILWLIVLISFLIFFVERNKDYLFYALYTAFISLLLLFAMDVFRARWIYTFFTQQLIGMAAFYFYFLFLRRIIDIEKVSRRLLLYFKSFGAIFLIFVLFAIVFLLLLKESRLYGFIIAPLAAVWVIPILYLNVKLLTQKNYIYKIFSIGSLILIVSAIYLVLSMVLDLPAEFLVLQIGVLVQVLVFTYLLIYKMRQNEKVKKLAQEDLIIQLRENEQLKDKVNRELEAKVKERTKEINEQKEEIQTQRDEIVIQRDLVISQKQELTDSINYAKRIQSAVLPDTAYLNRVMPDYFVIFKPRDIVSGDFYWVKDIKNYLVVVAADCTGHGVPGAFMSMLGITLLNELVTKSRFDKPGEILNYLRMKVKTMLTQEGKYEEQKDGMDMAIVIINTENKELQYAGAYNPLYLYRKMDVQKMVQEGNKEYSDDEYQLFELKGDRQPIGIHAIETDFTTHTLKLQGEETIYIFSDGFVDQFGGEPRKKYKTPRFKQLLQSVQDKPMEKQKVIIEEEFESWRGDIEQIDDVCIVGVRIN